MVDVPQVQGPGLPLEPPNPAKKNERTADGDKFQKEMHKKVEKVNETDPEQKKKRKRQEESEEEEKPQESTQAPTIPLEKNIFSPPNQEKKNFSSTLSIQEGQKAPPSSSTQPSEFLDTPPPTPAEPLESASADESDFDESAFISDSFDSYSQEQPPLPPPSAPTVSKAPGSLVPPHESLTDDSTSQEAVENTLGEQAQGQNKKKPTHPPSALSASPATSSPSDPLTPKKQTQSPAIQKEPPSSQEIEKKGISAAEIEGLKEQEPQSSAGFFQQLTDKEKKLKEEAAPQENLEKSMQPTLPLPSSPSLEKEKKKVEESDSLNALTALTSPDIPPSLPAVASPQAVAPINPYAFLHPDVMQLFDRMVGVMSVLSASGITETVITLNAPKFASSVFFGSQIILQEYTSAPQAFNIQINGTPQALALFQANAQELMAAFQYGNYTFRVNRLETGLLSEKLPLVKRKQGASGDKQDQKDQENQ